MILNNVAKCGISLRPFAARDFDAIYRWRSRIHELYVWNGERGYTDAETFKAELKEFQTRTDEIAIIERKQGAETKIAGFAYAEGIRPTRTSVSVGMYLDEEHRHSFVGPVAFTLFAWHLFVAHSRMKINLAVAGWNSPMLKLAQSTAYLIPEGIQCGELVLDGKSFDYHLFAFTRDKFDEARQSRFWGRFIE